MKKEQAFELFTMVAATWSSSWRPEQATIRLGVRFLEPYDASACEQAIAEFIRSGRPFAPTVGEIISRATEIGLERTGLPMLTASEAWEQVERANSIAGHLGNPHVDHDVINRAINAIGGWQEIRNASEPAVIRSQFRRAFEEFRALTLRQAVETVAAGNALPDKSERQKLLSDQREADRRESRQIERDHYVDQQARLYGLSREEAAEFLQSGLDYREFIARKTLALPAPEELN